MSITFRYTCMYLQETQSSGSGARHGPKFDTEVFFFNWAWSYPHEPCWAEAKSLRSNEHYFWASCAAEKVCQYWCCSHQIFTMPGLDLRLEPCHAFGEVFFLFHIPTSYIRYYLQTMSTYFPLKFVLCTIYQKLPFVHNEHIGMQ